MEHEAREAQPIGAQGAFASNSMHYTSTYGPPPPSPARPVTPPRSRYIRRWLTEKRFLETHIDPLPSMPDNLSFIARDPGIDPRNPDREICSTLRPRRSEPPREGARTINQSRDDRRESVSRAGLRKRIFVRNEFPTLSLSLSLLSCSRFFPTHCPEQIGRISAWIVTEMLRSTFIKGRQG